MLLQSNSNPNCFKATSMVKQFYHAVNLNIGFPCFTMCAEALVVCDQNRVKQATFCSVYWKVSKIK